MEKVKCGVDGGSASSKRLLGGWGLVENNEVNRSDTTCLEK